jgi:hypothetical protein
MPNPMLHRTLILLAVSFLAIAGCEIDFGSGGSDGALTMEAVLSGDVYEITPDTDVSNITVELEDSNTDTVYDDVTGSSGAFEIIRGFCGTSIVSLSDEEGELIGMFSVNVLPGSDTDVGRLTISSGVVTFEDDIITEFIGDVTENYCDGSTGSLTVEINHDCDTVEVLVTVENSTDVTRDDNDIECEDIDVGDELLIDSVLYVGDSVDAYDIEVIDD